MTLYPAEFPREARDHITFEKKHSYRELLPNQVYEGSDVDKRKLIICIVHLIRVFGYEVYSWRERLGWTRERIDREIEAFICGIAAEVIREKAPSLSNWLGISKGALDPVIVQSLKETEEWHDLERLKSAANSIDRTIAWGKTMLFEKQRGEELIDNDPPRAVELGIAQGVVDTIRESVRRPLFDDAALPRAIEIQWQPVLTSQKTPHQDAILGLTLALSAEFNRLIARTAAQFASALASAVISRGIGITIDRREAIWKECLWFGFRLVQWGPFSAWADCVTQVLWDVPYRADGSIDQGLKTGRVAKTRVFYEERNRGNGKEWLLEIDRAIDERLAIVPSSLKEERKAILSDRDKRILGVILRGPKLKGRQYCRELDNARISPPRKGVWKGGAREYESAYLSDLTLRRWIQNEKSKILSRAKRLGLA